MARLQNHTASFAFSNAFLDKQSPLWTAYGIPFCLGHFLFSQWGERPTSKL
jgi:hypothetical protein